jgi:hypothetical protein
MHRVYLILQTQISINSQTILIILDNDCFSRNLVQNAVVGVGLHAFYELEMGGEEVPGHRMKPETQDDTWAFDFR